MSETPEPVKFEWAKGVLTAALADIHTQIGLSETQTLAALECVLGEQRGQLLRSVSACMFDVATPPERSEDANA